MLGPEELAVQPKELSGSDLVLPSANSQKPFVNLPPGPPLFAELAKGCQTLRGNDSGEGW